MRTPSFPVASLVTACLGMGFAVVGGPACTPDSLVEPLPFAAASADGAPDPKALGPYPVGVKTLTFVDPERPGPDGAGSRTLVTEVWYPAAESARGQPGDEYVLYDSIREDVRQGLQPADLGTLQTVAVRDAAPRIAETFPVILFSHGKGGIRMQSTFYTVLLASHGYVVVAPDHEGDTINDLLAAGDVDVSTTAEDYIDRPLDMTFLLNELGRLDDTIAPLLDLQTVGVTGHSFGALTAMITVGQELRVDAAVAQCPAGISLVQGQLPMPLEEVGKPIMIQSAGQDQILEEDLHAQSDWDHMTSPRAWLSLHRAGHFTYSDLCIFDVQAIDDALAIDASNVLEDGCGPDNITPKTAFDLINSAAIGFFNVHLRHSEGSKKFLTQGTQDALAQGESTLIVE